MTTIAGQVASAAADAPLVATIHATERGRHQGFLPGDVSPAVDSIERVLSQRADRIITCSAAMRDEVAAQFEVDPARISVIPNGINTAEWQSPSADRAAARARWAANGPLVVYSGRLEVEKGIFTLADAIPAILEQAPTTRFAVAGNGQQGAAFDQKCADLGLTWQVERTGWLPEADLRALIGCADVAVVPSLYEPFGLVVLEAMSLGTPVVVSDTGGLADIIADGDNGLTFPPGDPAALASAILSVIADQPGSAQRAAVAREQLQTRYSWDRIADQTVETYASA